MFRTTPPDQMIVLKKGGLDRTFGIVQSRTAFNREGLFYILHDFRATIGLIIETAQRLPVTVGVTERLAYIGNELAGGTLKLMILEKTTAFSWLRPITWPQKLHNYMGIKFEN